MFSTKECQEPKTEHTKLEQSDYMVTMSSRNHSPHKLERVMYCNVQAFGFQNQFREVKLQKRCIHYNTGLKESKQHV
jgi:hypothetical protein